MKLKYKLFIYISLSLLAIASLFPPYHWGEERLQTDRERYRHVGDSVRAYEVLPIKKHAFLFSRSRQPFILEHYPAKINNDNNTGSLVDMQRYSDEELMRIAGIHMLQRKIIISDLLLEYFVAVILAYLIASIAIRIYPKDRLK